MRDSDEQHAGEPSIYARERALAALATRHHGVLSREELLACGFSSSAISRRAQAGRLRRILPRAYAVGHTALTPDGWRRASVLTCGPDAVLSHATAAAVLDLRATRAARVDVTTPHRGGRPTPRGVRLHRVPALEARDVIMVRGLPLTSAARTLFDLAGVVSPPALHRALRQAEVLRLDVGGRLGELIAAQPRRPGVPALRAALADGAPTTLTRSELEARMLELCVAAGLRRPAVNRRVRELEVDFLWRQEWLIVEIDTFRYHGTPTAFERDRRRDATLLAAGFRVMRITDHRLMREPQAVVALLRRLLG
jgi:very-short-patch-repair endonuclease